MMRYYYLNEAQAEKLRWWWQGLQPEGESTAGFVAGMGRQGRAALSHAHGAEDAMLVPAAHVLAAQLFALEEGKKYAALKDDYLAIGLVAGLLSKIRTDTKSGNSIVHALSGKEPLLQELRFSRLMKATAVDDFYRQMTRLVQLAGKKADIAVLADNILSWYIEKDLPLSNPNMRLKTRWAKDYYLSQSASN
jgi:CRISPR system Cascade subunit CasB